MDKKPKKYNKIKAIKKASRDAQGQHGKGGFHDTKKDKPRNKKDVRDYLEEVDGDE